jgi:hypothetical protein
MSSVSSFHKLEQREWVMIFRGGCLKEIEHLSKEEKMFDLNGDEE